MPFITDTQTGSTGRETTAEEALRRGSGTYARDIVAGYRDAASTAGMANMQSAASASSMGANPFIAQRNAARIGVQQAGQMRGEMMRAIAQRTRDLEAQRDREREAEQNRGRQMIGSLLQTGGAVASMIPGIGSAIGGAAGAVGGMVGGQPQQGGGIGGAVQGLMGAIGGQPQQQGGNASAQGFASAIGAQPQPMTQGAGAAAVGQSMAPPRTQAEYEFQQALPGLQQQQAQAQRATLEEQMRQRREGLFAAPASPGGAWWRNGR